MIPDYQTLMRPVLNAARNGETTPKETVKKLAAEFNLTEGELKEMLPSKRAPAFYNRIAWAKFYLQQAGLVKSTKRGYFEITEEGQKALTSSEKIDNSFLAQYANFQKFKNRSSKSSKKDKVETIPVMDASDSTPDEILNKAYETINDALAKELLQRVRTADPYFFESLIVKLLLAMGYGGSSDDAGRAIGKAGDDGVDGVIDQDPLGVDQVYVQAKRYADGNNIGSGAIRDFYGALSLKRAQKGIFFTTSKFSPAAYDTAKNLGMRIVLIDDVRLAKLMIKYNVGCECDKTIHLKKVDEEFFDESI